MNNSYDNQKAQNEDTVLLLRVQFRRNTSWQGTLQCMTTREKCVFRSVLELGSLMNEAVATREDDKDGLQRRNLIRWVNKEEVS
jgi:hypothetical protein